METQTAIASKHPSEQYAASYRVVLKRAIAKVMGAEVITGTDDVMSHERHEPMLEALYVVAAKADPATIARQLEAWYAEAKAAWEVATNSGSVRKVAEMESERNRIWYAADRAIALLGVDEVDHAAGLMPWFKAKGLESNQTLRAIKDGLGIQ